MSFLLMLALSVVALFLIVLILIQRGRGGGLAGALGGLGGQSAFGTKAGDVFTRVTIVVAGVWIALCALAVKLESGSTSLLTGSYGSALPKSAPAEGAPAPAPATTSGEGSSIQPAQPPLDAPPAAESATPPAAAPPAESTPPAAQP